MLFKLLNYISNKIDRCCERSLEKQERRMMDNDSK